MEKYRGVLLKNKKKKEKRKNERMTTERNRFGSSTRGVIDVCVASTLVLQPLDKGRGGGGRRGRGLSALI